MRGLLVLVLHAHLPFVRHPELESAAEEAWLFEALSECYLPLLGMLARLTAEGLPVRLALSLSPTLISMLEDELLQARYLRHLDALGRLSGREVRRTKGDGAYHSVARFYQRLWRERRDQFEGCGRSLLPTVRSLRDAGTIEPLCGTATHAYLPLLRLEPEAVRAQVTAGAAYCAKMLGEPAKGIWLAECGYYPGLDGVLKEAGLGYFFLESHGLALARPTPNFAPYEPVRCPSGLAAFARDQESCRMVWSAAEGYPGHPDYREFHRDIGFELPLEHLGDSLPGGERGFTGLKYWRVTDRASEAKEPYEPARAAARAREHAADFVFRLRGHVRYLEERMGCAPVVVAPYDAELFGHWWFEGPLFLEALIRELAAQDDIEMVTPSGCLERLPELAAAQPAASSWGADGYNAVWLSPENDWVWPQLHRAAEAMRDLAAGLSGQPGPLVRRALDQALRSLMLAQASDWPFLMRAGTSAQYACARLQGHLGSFFYLEQAIRGGHIDADKLAAIEELERVMPGAIDYRTFR